MNPASNWVACLEQGWNNGALLGKAWWMANKHGLGHLEIFNHGFMLIILADKLQEMNRYPHAWSSGCMLTMLQNSRTKIRKNQQRGALGSLSDSAQCSPSSSSQWGKFSSLVQPRQWWSLTWKVGFQARQMDILGCVAKTQQVTSCLRPLYIYYIYLYWKTLKNEERHRLGRYPSFLYNLWKFRDIPHTCFVWWADTEYHRDLLLMRVNFHQLQLQMIHIHLYTTYAYKHITLNDSDSLNFYPWSRDCLPHIPSPELLCTSLYPAFL